MADYHTCGNVAFHQGTLCGIIGSKDPNSWNSVKLHKYIPEIFAWACFIYLDFWEKCKAQTDTASQVDNLLYHLVNYILCYLYGIYFCGIASELNWYKHHDS